MTFTELSKLVLSLKGIEHGFIHHEVELRKDPKATRTAGGGWNSAHNWQHNFRVVLYMDRTFDTDVSKGPKPMKAKGGMAEANGPDVLAAIREALTALKLPIPATLPTHGTFE